MIAGEHLALGEVSRQVLEAKTQKAKVSVPNAPPAAMGPRDYTITVDGKAYQVHVTEGGATSVVQTASPVPTTQPAPTPTTSTSSQVVEAPTPGNILRLEVKVGD